MLRKQLNQRHPDAHHDLSRRYTLLYRGGHEFKAAVTQFLHTNPAEPAALYDLRKKAAAYISYVGPICDIFASQILAAPMQIATKRGDQSVQDLDQFYSSFKESVDGDVGTDLVDFFRHRLVDALVSRSSWILARLPLPAAPVESMADFQSQGLGEARLSPLPFSSVLDWHRDDEGVLQWVILHSRTQDRVDPTGSRDLITDTWQIFDPVNVTVYRKPFDPTKEAPRDEDDIPQIEARPHGFTRVPLVELRLPDGLWLLDRVADAQVEHFCLSNGLHWAMRRFCYPLPVAYLKDPESPPQIGTGSYMIMGADDKLEYASPDPAPLEAMAEEVGHQRDEIFRIAHATALGVDVNQAAAVGRSAESKAQDNQATDKALLAYAAVVKNAIEQTYELVSDARGDVDITFSIEGLDKFNLADVSRTLEAARTAKQLSVPSVTFKRELAKRVVDAVLPGLDQSKKDLITSEIEADNFEPVLPAMPGQMPGQDDSEAPDDDDSPSSKP